MIRIHPNLSRAACAATIALALGVAGCRSSSSGIAGNPFLAPDRVPPPSTRALLPGQAQPYYQGDPLPVMQSATTPPASAVAANQSEADARSSSGRTLAWNVPGGAAPAAVSAPPSGPIAVANEPSVAVPTDADPLRFALPTPAEPVTVAAVAVSPPPPPIHPPMQTPAAQPPQGVSLASYNAPAAGLPPTTNVPPMVQPQPIVSPWRAPQIAQPTAPPAYSPPNVQPAAAPPVQLPAPPVQLPAPPVVLPAPPTIVSVPPQSAMPANSIGVTLRAVASPAPQPGDPMPRIRIPDYPAPPQVTADGFRPRTSMQ